MRIAGTGCAKCSARACMKPLLTPKRQEWKEHSKSFLNWHFRDITSVGGANVRTQMYVLTPTASLDCQIAEAECWIVPIDQAHARWAPSIVQTTRRWPRRHVLVVVPCSASRRTRAASCCFAVCHPLERLTTLGVRGVIVQVRGVWCGRDVRTKSG